MSRNIFIGLSLVVLAGCQATVASDIRPSHVAMIASGQIAPEYRVQEGDVLSFHYYYTPELNSQQVVRSDGKISLTYLPDVSVAQMTIADVRTQLATAYRGILNDPVITVSVVQSSSGRVFIGGEVNKPGEIALGGRSSLLQMLFKAGGLKDTAAGSKVVLIRQGSGGATQRLQVDVDAMLEGRTPEQDFRLMPYDIVYVPQSAIAQVDQAADQYIHRLAPVAFVAQHTTNNAARQSVINSTTTTALPTAVTP